MKQGGPSETYTVGQVAQLTGLSPDVIRVWERRYQATRPSRTTGGTRRYTPAEINRLRILKLAVDSGHRIGDLASRPSAEIEGMVKPAEDPFPGDAIEATLVALDRLDAISAEAEIAQQLAALGPTRFAKAFAAPLVDAIGESWETNRLCVASEHLGSALLRSLLGAALRPTAVHYDAPLVLFATLSGERHELGLLIAAITALGAGANSLYLGPDLPGEELITAAARTGARAIALSSAAAEPADLAESIVKLRDALPDAVELWLGGQAGNAISLPSGVVAVHSLVRIEHEVERLRLSASREIR
jgi:DNA-binding transcriptional MerR regulator